jgi:hypothetical protein
VGALLSPDSGVSAVKAAPGVSLPRHAEPRSGILASHVHAGPRVDAPDVSTPKTKKSVSFGGPPIVETPCDVDGLHLVTGDQTAAPSVEIEIELKLAQWEYACDFANVESKHQVHSAAVLTPSGALSTARLVQLGPSGWRLVFVGSEIGTHQCMVRTCAECVRLCVRMQVHVRLCPERVRVCVVHDACCAWCVECCSFVMS